MNSRPVRLILPTGLFAEAGHEEQWYRPAVAELVADADRSLAAAAGEYCALLASSAREDIRRSLARFLSRFLLLEPDEESLLRVIDLWVVAQSEMLSRLSDDGAAIRDWRAQSSGLGKVVRVEGNLSDRHEGGRSAAILTFESGRRLVYKPRAMETERWYAELLGWLNESGTPMPFRAAAVLARDGYGWMEFVPHEPCHTEHELREYYRNAGALLCILHLLRANDCHFQNVISCGESPVLVDAEMLFQPSLRGPASTIVSQTGLIPNFRFGPDGQTYDVSGLGCVRSQTTHFEVPAWSEGGIRFWPGKLVPRKNVPFAEYEEPYPENYVDEMVDGFSQTYHFAASRRAALLEKIGSAAGLEVRYLVRETTEYYSAWTGEAESPLCLSELQPPFSALRPREFAALGQFDIPRFTLAASSRSLCGIEDCFIQSGHELAAAGIRCLDEKDLERQIHHLRLSWGLSRMARALTLESASEARPPKTQV
jgi:type 2 lantibiotic biosynthesis protein LanM